MFGVDTFISIKYITHTKNLFCKRGKMFTLFDFECATCVDKLPFLKKILRSMLRLKLVYD